MKNFINFFLKKLSYEIIAVKKFRNIDVSNPPVSQIFNFFPHWVSMFKIDNQNYGGETDYSSLRTSMLNMKELFDHVNFSGKRVLELGPLEAGNTIKLEGLQVNEIVSIEGRVESYIKCCVVKNLYSLNKTKFYLDDVRFINADKYGKFDIGVVLGLLYHLDDPASALNELANMADTLIISTHYADDISPYDNAPEVTLTTKLGVYKGKEYIEDPEKDLNAGMQNNSFWPYEEELIRMCRDSGFKNVTVLAKNPANEKYKLIYLVCTKLN